MGTETTSRYLSNRSQSLHTFKCDGQDGLGVSSSSHKDLPLVSVLDRLLWLKGVGLTVGGSEGRYI